MANITKKHILDVILDQVQDDDNNLWSYEDLLNWENLGERTIVSLSPLANSKRESIKLASGVKQSIPAGGIAFIRVIRNMGTDGLTAGTGVTPVAMDALAAFYPSWATETATQEIINAMPDPHDRTIFYVYPPSDGTGYVEEEYSVVPAIVAYDEDGDWESAHIGITEGYVDPLMNYIFHRAYGKDTDISGNKERAAEYHALFLGALGISKGGG